MGSRPGCVCSASVYPQHGPCGPGHQAASGREGGQGTVPAGTTVPEAGREGGARTQ